MKERLQKFLSDTYELSATKSRLSSMEGLRGLAVLLVFTTHFRELFRARQVGAPSTLFRFLMWTGDLGNVGVDLFFVLSGFLIYGALMRREFSFPTFIRRRVERIYPTFLVVFGIYLVLSKIFPAESKIPAGLGPATLYLVENLLFLPGMFDIKPVLVVAWSLSFEFFFYLALPLLIRVTVMKSWTRGRRVLFFSLLWCAYAVFCFTITASRCRLLAFIPGIILCDCLQSKTFLAWLTGWGEKITIVLVVLSFVPIALYFHQENLWYCYLPVPLAFFLLSAYCFGFEGVLQSGFSWAPLRYLGNMSYSYYLIHALTLKGLARVLKPQADILSCLGALIVAFTATWVVASLLFILVEKPASLVQVARKKPDDPLSSLPMPVREGL